MSNPQQAKTIADLRALSEEELVEQYDMLSKSTAVGVSYYLEELERRRVDKQSRLMSRLTWVIAVLTVVNVLAVIISFTP